MLKKIIEKLSLPKSISPLGYDGYEATENDPLFEAHLLLNNYLTECFDSPEATIRNYTTSDKALKKILNNTPETLLSILKATIIRKKCINQKHKQEFDHKLFEYSLLFSYVIKNTLIQKLPYSLSDLKEILKSTFTDIDYTDFDFPVFIKSIHKYLAEDSSDEELRRVLREFLASDVMRIDPNSFSYNEAEVKRIIHYRTLEALGEYNTVQEMKKMFDWYGSGNLKETASDKYQLFDKDPYFNEHLLINTILKECEEGDIRYYSFKPDDVPSGKVLLSKSAPELLKFVNALLIRIVWAKVEPEAADEFHIALLNSLMKRKLNYEVNDFIFIINCVKDFRYFKNFYFLNFLKNVEGYIKSNGMSGDLKKALQDLNQSEVLNPSWKTDDLEKIKTRIRELTGEKSKESLDAGDDFGKLINDFMESIPSGETDNWNEIIRQSKKSGAGKPTAKFLEDYKKSVGKIGEEAYKNKAMEWLSFLAKLPVKEEQLMHGNYAYTNRIYLKNENIAVAKGLIWSIGLFRGSEICRVLADLTEKCFQKIPGTGPISAALGNACIYILATTQELDGIAYLVRLKLRIKQNNTRKSIETYISTAAGKLNISEGEIEDIATPSYGLSEGKLAKELGNCRAELTITGIGKTDLRWFNENNKEVKSVPSEVKNNYGKELKDLKQTISDIQKMITAQRDRLDRSFIKNRIWTFKQFEERLHNHGLMSYITRQLIWTFENGNKKDTGIFYNGNFINVKEEIIEFINEATIVRLWHPIGNNIDFILQWRDFLEKKQIRQPVKQAYREVYILTDAERKTDIYSNRMAAHILKQHQFNNLAKMRGWSYSLLGAYDDGRYNEQAHLTLPEYNLQAEFWVNEVNEQDAFNDVGIWNYVATDQVRFVENGQPVALHQIDPLVFSEVMRDVDLFVGVASVGNDPTWRDSGGLVNYRDYWNSYSFGDLSETAKTRKQVLEKLIPRLKISSKCKITDKFLVVEGNLRTYKIHLGSTNILMEPNDQYLCIVPDSKAKEQDKVFLPFEGDNSLSIILSKAFLLADDKNITDPTITRQLAL